MKKYKHICAITAIICTLLCSCNNSDTNKIVSQTSSSGITTESTSESTSEDSSEAITETTSESTADTTETTEATTETTTEATTEATTTPTTEPQTEKDTTPKKTETNNSPAVTMAFTGDIFFSDSLYGYYTANGVAGFLSDKVRKNLYDADLYIADHEFVCSDRGEMAEYQIYTFRAPTNREVIFKEMGADVVTLANNHTLDYGVVALQDTFSILNDLEIDYVGAGNNLDEALTPVIREVNGKRIAIFGTTRFVPQAFWYATASNPGLLTTYESTGYFGMICDAIANAKKTCDYVIVFTHFGEEKQNTVEPYQKTVSYGYIDSGADLVVACHPHVLQGMEFYKGKPIAYSLGNFLFSNYHSDTVVLNVTINEDNSSSVSLLPCSSQLYKTTDVTGEAATNLLEYIESISFNVDIDKDGNVTERK